MKYNFVVSDYRKLWIEGATCLYIVEPYVYYRLKRTGHDLDYDDVIVAPYRRQSSSDLEKDHNFVQLKFDKYVNILAERLNQIHGTSYGGAFWRRALSISFERYITFLHEMFENCELHFEANKHDCYVLSRESYHIPLDFREQRNFLQYSNYGQEQIYSIYMHTFYPSGLKTTDDQYEAILKSSSKTKKILLVLGLLKQGFSGANFERVKKILLRIFYSRKSLRIGIMGSFFSTKYLNLLMTKSKGSIRFITWQIDLKSDNIFLWDNRKFLSEEQHDFDKFDRFFFASMGYCFPKIFVEYFKEVERQCVNHFDKYDDLEFVTNESWPSNDTLCIVLALLKERGIRHIYNEHNYLEHPWVGSTIYKAAELSDIFVSIGWHSDKINNMVRGASLFAFNLNRKPKKRYKICFISSGATSKRPQYTASYGWACENAPKYFKFVRLFLRSLSNQTRCEMLYRGYPVSNLEDWLAYDQDFMLDPYLEDMEKSDVSISGKLVMLQSNLVIVDYLSTAYLEALIMNIPTIFFWNTDAYYLSNDYSDFFDSLISVGICQTDPIEAAKFVEQVKDNPDEWWQSESVQVAKNRFLSENIGDPQIMIDYLTELSVV